MQFAFMCRATVANIYINLVLSVNVGAKIHGVKIHQPCSAKRYVTGVISVVHRGGPRAVSCSALALRWSKVAWETSLTVALTLNLPHKTDHYRHT